MIWGVRRNGTDGGTVPSAGLCGLKSRFLRSGRAGVCDDYHVFAWGEGGVGEDGLGEWNVVLQGFEENFQESRI